MKTYKFLVPIYVELEDPENDATATLAGALGFMEDHTGGIFADTERMDAMGEVNFDWEENCEAEE